MRSEPLLAGLAFPQKELSGVYLKTKMLLPNSLLKTLNYYVMISFPLMDGSKYLEVE